MPRKSKHFPDVYDFNKAEKYTHFIRAAEEMSANRNISLKQKTPLGIYDETNRQEAVADMVDLLRNVFGYRLDGWESNYSRIIEMFRSNYQRAKSFLKKQEELRKETASKALSLIEELAENYEVESRRDCLLVLKEKKPEAGGLEKRIKVWVADPSYKGEKTESVENALITGGEDYTCVLFPRYHKQEYRSPFLVPARRNNIRKLHDLEMMMRSINQEALGGNKRNLYYNPKEDRLEVIASANAPHERYPNIRYISIREIYPRGSTKKMSFTTGATMQGHKVALPSAEASRPRQLELF